MRIQLSHTAGASALSSAANARMHDPKVSSPVSRKHVGQFGSSCEQGLQDHSRNACIANLEKLQKVKHTNEKKVNNTQFTNCLRKLGAVMKMRDVKHEEGLKQIRLQLCDVDFELQNKAQITDVQRLNSETHDIFERIKEIENFVVMPPWIQDCRDSLRHQSSRISCLEERLNTKPVLHNTLEANSSACQTQNGCGFEKSGVSLGVIGHASVESESFNFADKLIELDHRLAHIENAIIPDVLEHSLQETKNQVEVQQEAVTY